MDTSAMDGAAQVWWSPVGSFLVTLGLTYPANCPLGGTETLTGSALPPCENVLGFTALTLAPGEAGVIAGGIAIICWAIAAALHTDSS